MRLVTPCCAVPVMARPFQCMHEYEEWRRRRDATGQDPWPRSHVLQRRAEERAVRPLVLGL